MHNAIHAARFLLTAALASATLAPLLAEDKESARERAKRFDEQVAPILVRHCFECHEPNGRKGGLDLTRRAEALRGGESGEVIVAGKPEDSYLWEQVRDGNMPPKHPLSEQDREIIRRWIADGAAWGADPIDPFRYSSPRRAGYDWWSLQPLKDVEPPRESFPGWSRNAVDRFIAQGLKKKGLQPSPQAPRRILIRRLSFDLLGLPPTPEEIQRFEADTRPDAYERLVDRLLSSPRYGVRWGRHWLDLARFGESQGFERDKLRTNAWPYRDWVIDSLNRDLSYREFVRRQIAGDVLRPDDPDAVLGTGFLVAAPWDEVGNGQQSAAMRAVVRQDELEDLVSVVSQTFLGLTVNCARCHDHKFDPIRQREYYQLTAALGGVRHGQRDVVRPQDKTLAAELSREIKTLRDRIATIDQAAWKRVLAKRTKKQQERPVSPPPPTPFASWDFQQSLQDQMGALNGTPNGGAVIEGGALRVNGRSFASTAALQKDIGEKTLEAWVRLDSLGQRGGAAISLQTLDGVVFDAIVFGEKEAGRWMAGSNGFVRTSSFHGPNETLADSQYVHVAIVYHEDGRIEAYRQGQAYGKPYRSAGLQRFAKGKTQVIFGLRHLPPGGNRFLTGAIRSARLYDRALSAEEVKSSFQAAEFSISSETLRAALTPAERRGRDLASTELLHKTRTRDGLKPMSVYLVAPRPPESTFLLLRGNPAARSDQVHPGGVRAVRGVDADFGLSQNATDDQRRVKLADWITAENNPLFARVIANRVWHYHFGVGIVDTPNDLGFNGGRATHPKLLDYLATSLRRDGWTLKGLHRRIVTSATYRQSSTRRAEAAAVDADNRLLWRMAGRRLEAEAIRDAALFAAGELNEQMGGPGFRDFRTFTKNTQFYEMLDPIGAEFNRRSIYRTWVRSGRSRFLDVFDCPDPSTKSPKRAVTVTPLQALTLMNHSFVLRIADQIAARVGGGDVKERVGRLFELLYGRAPGDRELELSTAFASRHGEAALARVLLNSNEFVFID